MFYGRNWCHKFYYLFYVLNKMDHFICFVTIHHIKWRGSMCSDASNWILSTNSRHNSSPQENHFLTQSQSISEREECDTRQNKMIYYDIHSVPYFRCVTQYYQIISIWKKYYDLFCLFYIWTKHWLRIMILVKHKLLWSVT